MMRLTNVSGLVYLMISGCSDPTHMGQALQGSAQHSAEQSKNSSDVSTSSTSDTQRAESDDEFVSGQPSTTITGVNLTATFENAKIRCSEISSSGSGQLSCAVYVEADEGILLPATSVADGVGFSWQVESMSVSDIITFCKVTALQLECQNLHSVLGEDTSPLIKVIVTNSDGDIREEDAVVDAEFDPQTNVTDLASESEPLDRTPLNREPLNREPLNREPLNREPLNREPLNREPLNRTLPNELNNQQSYIQPSLPFQSGVERMGNDYVLRPLRLDERVMPANQGGHHTFNMAGNLFLLSMDGPFASLGKSHFANLAGSGSPFLPHASSADFTRTPTFQPGILGHALWFDGINDELMVPTITPPSQGTIIVWINPSIAESRIVGSSQNFAMRMDSLGLICNDFHRLGDHSLCSHSRLAPHQWTHVAMSWDLTHGKREIYLNGILHRSRSGMQMSQANTSSLFIGSAQGLSYFSGGLDELAIFNRLLSADEIASLFLIQSGGLQGMLTSEPVDSGSEKSEWKEVSWNIDAPWGRPLISKVAETDFANGGFPASLFTSLEVFWNMEAAPGILPLGSEIKELGGGATNAVVEDGQTKNSVILVPSPMGTGVALDGVDDFLRVAHNSSHEINGELSLSVWFLPHRTDAVQTIIAKRFATVYDSYKLQVTADGDASFCLESSKTNCLRLGRVNYNRWNHVVASWNGSVMSGWINGLPSDNLLDHNKPIDYANKPLYIGAENENGQMAAFFFQGVIDEVLLWSRVLSLSEVRLLHSRGLGSIGMQVRSCSTQTCNNEPWQGPDGSEKSWYSEAMRMTVAPQVPFQLRDGLVGRWFQYRIRMKTSSQILAPRFSAVSLEPLLP